MKTNLKRISKKAIIETKPELESKQTPKPETKPKPKLETEPEAKVEIRIKKKLKELRKDFDELRHKFSKTEIKEYRKAFYIG